MFTRLHDDKADGGPTIVTIHLDGVAIPARAGDTVAAALIAANAGALRKTPVSGADRAPFCMMGVCFDCLAMVDGIANRQTCLIPVRDGMRIDRQDGRRKVGA